MKTKSALLLLAIGLAVAPASGAVMWNVNFNGFTGNPGPTQDETTLAGPAGGLGTSWNQFAANSGSSLVDSSGTPTAVAFSTNFTEGRYDGTSPSEPMLRAHLTDFGRNQTRDVDITGLAPNGLYNVWLVSHRHQGGVAERQNGSWTAENSTSSPTTQVVDGRGGPLTGDSFVAGRNFALFENVVADGSGNISFEGQAAGPDQSSQNGYRLHLSGFQIAQVPEPASAFLLGLGGLMVFVRRRR